jgi:propionate CoA-transferase
MRVVSLEQAVSILKDGDSLVIGGSGGGHSVPEDLLAALERRFIAEGRPRQITSIHPVGLGDEKSLGVDHFAHPGMLKRCITGTYVDSPHLAELVKDDALEAYNLPQGAISQLMREMAAGRVGLITHVGLHTFVDPRVQGGKQSPSAKEDLVEVIQIHGEEKLFYKPYHFDVAFLRGTTSDEDGNITMEQEAVFGEMLSMAQATRRQGGVVIVQVKRLCRRGTLPGKTVKIPGILVDLVVVVPDQRQSYLTEYSPAFAGELRVPLDEIERLPFGPRKVIARRAAMELYRNAVCNLGSGISTGIANVAAEEGILEMVTLTNEQGLIGGAPATGVEAGAATNFHAMIDQPYQFDFYDGGGLDLAFLSFGQFDSQGNVNVSRFGPKVIGPGGFINISQNAKKAIFSGTFTASGLDIQWQNGQTRIVKEGKFLKLVQQVEQITYHGQYGLKRGQEVLYITERAVFRGTLEGPELIEIAPGIDLERDVLGRMEFKPRIAEHLREMDGRLFKEEKMNLEFDLSRKPARNQPVRLLGSNW